MRSINSRPTNDSWEYSQREGIVSASRSTLELSSEFKTTSYGMRLTCSCCGLLKKKGEFTATGSRPSKHCKDCGVWLKLFRQVFDAPSPKTTQARARAVKAKALAEEKVSAYTDLYAAFGMNLQVSNQLVKDSNDR